jgi:hypothetical protein
MDREYIDAIKQTESGVAISWQLTTFAALYEDDPMVAADLWNRLSDYYSLMLDIFFKVKELHPGCDTTEIVSQIKGYKEAAEERCRNNMNDAKEANFSATETQA